MMKVSHTVRTALAPSPTTLAIESWRLLWEECLSDPVAMEEYHAWEERRRRAQPQMLELLRSFIAKTVDLEHFRATFDQRTKTSWDLFGLRGASGSMFLNKLVKYVPDSAALAHHLRSALHIPATVAEG